MQERPPQEIHIFSPGTLPQPMHLMQLAHIGLSQNRVSQFDD